MKVDLPRTLLDRAHVEALDEARDLVTIPLERYVQELERGQRQLAHEAYYAARTHEDEAEERELIADSAFADAEAADEFLP